MTQPSVRSSWAWSATVALAAFALYLAWAPTFSGDKDGGEFTLVLAFGGVAHPTGYPLYALGGHLFVVALHALGADWAFAANAFSALGGALAVFFLHALAEALVPASLVPSRRQRAALALLPACLFGLNPVWTYAATLAEVYSWHVAWVGACACGFVVLMHSFASDAPLARRRGMLLALGWGLLCGIGGAHHTTALFVAAPLSIGLFLFGLKRRRAGLFEAALVLAGAVVALASYAFVAYRAFHPAVWQWPTLVANWQGVWAHVSGAQYQGYLGRFAPNDQQRQLLARYVYPFLFPALALFALSLLRLRRGGQRAILWSLLGAVLLPTLHAFTYGVSDPSTYFLAPMALALTGAFGAVLHFFDGTPSAKKLGTPVVVGLGLLTLVLCVRWTDTGIERKGVFSQSDRRVRRMWESIAVDQAIVLWQSDMYTRLVEFQLLRHEKPGIDVENPALLNSKPVRERFIARHGFDPVEGLSLAATGGPRPRQSLARGLTDQVADLINRRTPLPVILFAPQTESVRILPKP